MPSDNGPAPAWPAWSRVDDRGLARFATPQASQWLPLPINRHDNLLEPDHHRIVAQAVYQALSQCDIRYALEAYHPAQALQIIRTPPQILRSPREGTCLDLAALFCGLCLAYDLLPMLIIIEGHALAAVSLTHGQGDWNEYRPGRHLFETGPLTDAQPLRDLIDEGSFIAVECTGFAHSEQLSRKVDDTPEAQHRSNGVLSFDQAVQAGRQQLDRADRPFQFAIDIAMAHNAWRIKPHPVETLVGGLEDIKLLLRQGLQLFRGSAGDPGISQFLGDSFLEVVPRSDFLYECRDLREGRREPTRYSRRRVTFHVLTVISDVVTNGSRPFEIRSIPLRPWLELVEAEPVVLLLAHPVRLAQLRFRMLWLHDWVVRRARQPSPDWDDVQAVPLTDFIRVDPGGVNFHARATEDLDRVTGSSEAMWRTLKDYGLIPVDEMTLLEFIEFARFLEAPKKVFDQFAEIGRFTDVVVDYMRTQGITSNPIVDQWLRSIRQLTTGSSEFERRQFKRFSSFMEKGGKGVRLPPFRGPEVGCWRTFVAMYPDALKGLEFVVRNSQIGNDVAFAAAMLPMLSLSTDRIISAKASAVLKKVPDRIPDFPAYAVRRELLRAPAEGGVDGWLSKAVDLVAKEGINGSEQRWLTHYGWTVDLVEANVERKLTAPTIRDERIPLHYEAIGYVAAATRNRRSSRRRATL